jgi:ATP-dependent RNA helicase DeaD
MNKENHVFAGIELVPEIQMAIDGMGFVKATPVQEKTIPEMMNGEDLIVQAPTGTGKTGAFGIPIIQMAEPRAPYAQALILSPTRELAIQTTRVLQKLTQLMKGIRIATLYGGERIEKQFSILRTRPQIIVATPGRLTDHLRRGSINMETIKTVVLDEADRMLDMGFQEDLTKILQMVPGERQTVLFSATLPREILEIARNYQRNAKHIVIKQDTLTVKTVQQYYTTVNSGAKESELLSLLKGAASTLCLVFVNTKRMADTLCADLKKQNLRVDALHGDINQQMREKIMNSFRTGGLDILIATDVAARGIDVRNIDLVVNYDLPMDSESTSTGSAARGVQTNSAPRIR